MITVSLKKGKGGKMCPLEKQVRSTLFYKIARVSRREIPTFFANSVPPPIPYQNTIAAMLKILPIKKMKAAVM